MGRKRRHNSSPQARWAERKRLAGLCRICAKPRNRYKWLCDEHAIMFRQYMREWRKSKKVKDPNAPPGPGPR